MVKWVLGRREETLLDYGAFTFNGPVAGLLGKIAMPITLALVAFVTLWLGGKVFSPQYFTWALPLAFALPGRAWKRVAFVLGLVVLVSQIYLRGYYDHAYNQWPAGVFTVVARLGLLGLFSRMLLVRLRPWYSGGPSPRT